MQRTPTHFLHMVFFWKMRQKMVKNTGQCYSIESKAMYKNSADLDKNKKEAVKVTWVGYAPALHAFIIMTGPQVVYLPYY